MKTVPVWVRVTVIVAVIAAAGFVAWHLAGGGVMGMH